MTSSLPALMLEKCAQTIENVIIPALSDEVVIIQSRYTAAILHALAPALEEKSKTLSEENHALREVLARIQQARSLQNPSSNPAWGALAEILERRFEHGGDVLGENHALKAALADCIRTLDALAAEFSPEPLAALKQQIHAVLRLQLDHALSLLPRMPLKV